MCVCVCVCVCKISLDSYLGVSMMTMVLIIACKFLLYTLYSQSRDAFTGFDQIERMGFVWFGSMEKKAL